MNDKYIFDPEVIGLIAKTFPEWLATIPHGAELRLVKSDGIIMLAYNDVLYLVSDFNR